MDTINIQSDNTNMQITIRTDIPFWNYLVQGMKKKHKISRAEAFKDLVERQRIALLKGEDTSMDASIQVLAKSWGWNRETVTRFIDNLERLNVLSVNVSGKRKTFSLKYIIENKKAQGDLNGHSEPRKPSGGTDTHSEPFTVSEPR